MMNLSYLCGEDIASPPAQRGGLMMIDLRGLGWRA